MTYSGKTDMPRREVVHHAKAAVLAFGPDAILSHAEECIQREHSYDEGFPVAEVAREAEKQAYRVYEFLGWWHA